MRCTQAPLGELTALDFEEGEQKEFRDGHRRRKVLKSV